MIEKVTAFILRQHQDKSEILTIYHPSAGRQLPAGTVEEHETPEQAVLREIQEETGLSKLRIIAKKGEKLSFTMDNEYILLSSTRFYAWPAQSARREGPLFTRGFRVNAFERKAGFAHVIYKEMDFNKTPPTLLWEKEGWLPSEMLTREMKRHFYQIEVLEETLDVWEQPADFGYTFRLEWLPVVPRPIFIGEQNTWLDYYKGE